MDATLAREGAYGRNSGTLVRRIAAIVAVVAVVAVVVIANATAGLLQPQAPIVPALDNTLNAQQLIIQSEIEDRYGPAGLTPEQVVIQGEVQNRYAPAAGELNAQQLVIQGEVADRYR